MEKDYLPHARTVQSPCCPRLDGLPLPWSARWRTKGKRNGMFKRGLYTKEAVQERRLLPELLRQSILADQPLLPRSAPPAWPDARLFRIPAAADRAGGRAACDARCPPRPELARSAQRHGVRPWSWTGSRGGFDPLPGVVILRLRGAQVAERGVEPASVVDLVNEAGKIRGDVLECFVVHKVDGFDLQRLDEAFGLGVVVGVSTPAHRADEPMLCEQLAVSLAGILRTSI